MLTTCVSEPDEDVTVTAVVEVATLTLLAVVCPLATHTGADRYALMNVYEHAPEESVQLAKVRLAFGDKPFAPA